jgi:hypothetical protein
MVRYVQRIVMYPPDSTCGTSAIYVPAYQGRRASLRHGRLHRLSNASSLRHSTPEPQQAISPVPGGREYHDGVPWPSFVREGSVTGPARPAELHLLTERGVVVAVGVGGGYIE